MGNAKSKVVSKLSNRSAARQRRDLADLVSSHEYLSTERRTSPVPERCFSADDILSLDDDALGYRSPTQRFSPNIHSEFKSTYNITDQKPKRKRKYLNFKLRKHLGHSRHTKNSDFNLGESGSSQSHSSLNQSCNTLNSFSSTEYLNRSPCLPDEVFDQLISKILVSNQQYSNEELVNIYCSELVISGILPSEDRDKFSSEIIKHTANFSSNEMVNFFSEMLSENTLNSSQSLNHFPSEPLENPRSSSNKPRKSHFMSKLKKSNPISKFSRFLRRRKLFSKKSKLSETEPHVFATNSESIPNLFSNKEFPKTLEDSSNVDFYSELHSSFNQLNESISFRKEAEVFPGSSASKLSANNGNCQRPMLKKCSDNANQDNSAALSKMRPIDNKIKLSSSENVLQKKANESQNVHDVIMRSVTSRKRAPAPPSKAIIPSNNSSKELFTGLSSAAIKLEYNTKQIPISKTDSTNILSKIHDVQEITLKPPQENIRPPKTASQTVLPGQTSMASNTIQNHGMKPVVIVKPKPSSSSSAIVGVTKPFFVESETNKTEGREKDLVNNSNDKTKPALNPTKIHDVQKPLQENIRPPKIASQTVLSGETCVESKTIQNNEMRPAVIVKPKPSSSRSALVGVTKPFSVTSESNKTEGQTRDLAKNTNELAKPALIPSKIHDVQKPTPEKNLPPNTASQTVLSGETCMESNVFQNHGGTKPAVIGKPTMSTSAPSGVTKPFSVASESNKTESLARDPSKYTNDVSPLASKPLHSPSKTHDVQKNNLRPTNGNSQVNSSKGDDTKTSIANKNEVPINNCAETSHTDKTSTDISNGEYHLSSTFGVLPLLNNTWGTWFSSNSGNQSGKLQDNKYFPTTTPDFSSQNVSHSVQLSSSLNHSFISKISHPDSSIEGNTELSSAVIKLDYNAIQIPLSKSTSTNKLSKIHDVQMPLHENIRLSKTASQTDLSGETCLESSTLRNHGIKPEIVVKPSLSSSAPIGVTMTSVTSECNKIEGQTRDLAVKTNERPSLAAKPVLHPSKIHDVQKPLHENIRPPTTASQTGLSEVTYMESSSLQNHGTKPAVTVKPSSSSSAPAGVSKPFPVASESIKTEGRTKDPARYTNERTSLAAKPALNPSKIHDVQKPTPENNQPPNTASQTVLSGEKCVESNVFQNHGTKPAVIGKPTMSTSASIGVTFEPNKTESLARVLSKYTNEVLPLASKPVQSPSKTLDVQKNNLRPTNGNSQVNSSKYVGPKQHLEVDSYVASSLKSSGTGLSVKVDKLSPHILEGDNTKTGIANKNEVPIDNCAKTSQTDKTSTDICNGENHLSSTFGVLPLLNNIWGTWFSSNSGNQSGKLQDNKYFSATTPDFSPQNVSHLVQLSSSGNHYFISKISHPDSSIELSSAVIKLDYNAIQIPLSKSTSTNKLSKIHDVQMPLHENVRPPKTASQTDLSGETCVEGKPLRNHEIKPEIIVKPSLSSSAPIGVTMTSVASECNKIEGQTRDLAVKTNERPSLAAKPVLHPSKIHDVQKPVHENIRPPTTASQTGLSEVTYMESSSLQNHGTKPAVTVKPSSSSSAPAGVSKPFPVASESIKTEGRTKDPARYTNERASLAAKPALNPSKIHDVQKPTPENNLPPNTASQTVLSGETCMESNVFQNHGTKPAVIGKPTMSTSASIGVTKPSSVASESNKTESPARDPSKYTNEVLPLASKPVQSPSKTHDVPKNNLRPKNGNSQVNSSKYICPKQPLEVDSYVASSLKSSGTGLSAKVDKLSPHFLEGDNTKTGIANKNEVPINNCAETSQTDKTSTDISNDENHLSSTFGVLPLLNNIWRTWFSSNSGNQSGKLQDNKYFPATAPDFSPQNVSHPVQLSSSGNHSFISKISHPYSSIEGNTELSSAVIKLDYNAIQIPLSKSTSTNKLSKIHDVQMPLHENIRPPKTASQTNLSEVTYMESSALQNHGTRPAVTVKPSSSSSAPSGVSKFFPLASESNKTEGRAKDLARYTTNERASLAAKPALNPSKIHDVQKPTPENNQPPNTASQTVLSGETCMESNVFQNHGTKPAVIEKSTMSTSASIGVTKPSSVASESNKTESPARDPSKYTNEVMPLASKPVQSPLKAHDVPKNNLRPKNGNSQVNSSKYVGPKQHLEVDSYVASSLKSSGTGLSVNFDKLSPHFLEGDDTKTGIANKNEVPINNCAETSQTDKTSTDISNENFYPDLGSSNAIQITKPATKVLGAENIEAVIAKKHPTNAPTMIRSKTSDVSQNKLRNPTKSEKILISNKTQSVLKQIDTKANIGTNGSAQGVNSILKEDKMQTPVLEQNQKSTTRSSQDQWQFSNDAKKKSYSEILKDQSTVKSNTVQRSTRQATDNLSPSDLVTSLDKNCDQLSTCHFPSLGPSKASTSGVTTKTLTFTQQKSISLNNLKISSNSTKGKGLNTSNNSINNAQGIRPAVSYSSLFKTSDNKKVQITAPKNKILFEAKDYSILSEDVLMKPKEYIVPPQLTSNRNIRVHYYSTKVCPQYNSQAGCSFYWCFRFHVCYYWILGRCIANNCKKYHSFQSYRNDQHLGRTLYNRLPDETLMRYLKSSTFHWREIIVSKAEPLICISYLKQNCLVQNCKDFHNSSPYSWQILLKSKWILFSNTLNHEIELKYCDPNNDFITFNVDSSEEFLTILPELRGQNLTFHIDFDSMTLSTSGNVTYTIRRLSTISDVACHDSLSTRFLWLWQDKNGKWNLYRNGFAREFFVISVSDYIELMFQKGEAKILISLNNKDHILDLDNLLDTDVDRSDVRKMRTRPVLVKKARYETLPFANIGLEIRKQNLSRKLIPENSMEFAFVKAMMIKSLPLISEMLVERIENVFLWKAYQMRKEQMFAKYESNKEMVNEQYLFHGTDYSVVNKICEENFDWRLFGSKVGNIWGKGTYFSNCAYFSDKYSSLAPNGYNCMFIALVLTGTATIGNPQMDLPPMNPETNKRFDSTVNKDLNPHIFVKYNMDEYYPAYFVQYR